MCALHLSTPIPWGWWSSERSPFLLRLQETKVLPRLSLERQCPDRTDFPGCLASSPPTSQPPLAGCIYGSLQHPWPLLSKSNVWTSKLQPSHFQEAMTIFSFVIFDSRSSQGKATADIPLAELIAVEIQQIHVWRPYLSSGGTYFISTCFSASFLGNCYDCFGAFPREASNTAKARSQKGSEKKQLCCHW